MNIILIGTGNTATVLGRKLVQGGHRIGQVYGRDPGHANALSREFNCIAVNSIPAIQKGGDLYIIAVTDSAVEEIARQWTLTDVVLVHTAASLSKEILKEAAEHYGVFYPFQSLRKESVFMPEIPFIIEGSDEKTRNLLLELGRSLSVQVVEMGAEERRKLHLAAVITNNFGNHLLALTEYYCKKEGVDFTLLFPLLHETINRLELLPAALSQTGPAIRRDKKTIASHLELLEDYPALKKMYAIFTTSIQELN